MTILLLVAIVAISMILLEILASKTRLSSSILRKISHLGISFLVILIALLFDYRLLIPVSLMFFVILLGLRLFHPLRSLDDRAGQSFGVVLFPLGVMVAAAICQTNWQLITIILILGIADTLAYFLGRFISSPIIVFRKTVIGSLAFLLSTSLILWLATPLDSLNTVLVALILTITELISPHGSDNLTVPTMAAILLALVIN